MHGRFKSMYTLALVDTSWAFEEHVHPKVGSQSAFSTKEQVWSDLVHILSTHRANSLIPMQHVCKKAKLCQNKPSYSLCLLSNLLNLHQQVKKYCKGNENTQRYVTLCAQKVRSTSRIINMNQLDGMHTSHPSMQTFRPQDCAAWYWESPVETNHRNKLPLHLHSIHFKPPEMLRTLNNGNTYSHYTSDIGWHK